MITDQEQGELPIHLLERLNVLVGEWRTVASVGGHVVGHGRAVFWWMQGEPFLMQRADADRSNSVSPGAVASAVFPVTTIIGLDDTTGTYWQLYAGPRGVRRVYEMSLDGTVWKLWRKAPGTSERFTGDFNDDGSVMTGRWESSPDGQRWELDVDLTYIRPEQ